MVTLAAVIVLLILVVWALLHMLGLNRDRGGKGNGSALGSVFGWLFRSLWAFILWLWTSPMMRLVLASGLMIVVLWWFWWPALISSPGIVWSAILVAVACALLGVVAASIHHVAPNWWRPLAIGRTGGYAVLSGPLALALGQAVTVGPSGTVLGILAWLLIAAGLAAHLLTGSEFRQAPIQQ